MELQQTTAQATGRRGRAGPRTGAFTRVELPGVSKRGFTLVELPVVSKRQGGAFTLVELPVVSKRGFTLVELLVVVGIISLLITLLMPTLNTLRGRVRQIQCLSNQGNIVRALRLYEGEWKWLPYNYAMYAQAANAKYGWEAVDYVDANVGDGKQRWALACIASYLGGPRTPYLRGLKEGQFPSAYICPSATKETIFAPNNAETKDDNYHASYWTNIAIRLNCGWQNSMIHMNGDYGDQFGPGDNRGNANGGAARICGACNVDWPHWRSVYHPTTESVPLPQETMFCGDTRNYAWANYPAGKFKIYPGWGGLHVFGSLGFERHSKTYKASEDQPDDILLVGYMDGHAGPFARARLDNDFGHFYGDLVQPFGTFMIPYPDQFNCMVVQGAYDPSKMHPLPRAPVN